jgi:hypothetical protein
MCALNTEIAGQNKEREFIFFINGFFSSVVCAILTVVILGY